jgi:prepilin-type processing-associated H-X9-DG protein
VVNPAGPIQSEPVGYHMSWVVQLLPYIDEQVTFKHVDFSVGAYHQKNTPVRKVQISTVSCPSDYTSKGDRWESNYAGCHHDVEAPIDKDNHGVFFLNSSVRSRDVPDGTSHTIFVGEKIHDDYGLGWMSGTRATLRNTGTVINQTAAYKPSADPWAKVFGAGTEEEDQGQGGEGEGAAKGEAGPKSKLEVGGFSSQHPGGANFVFGDGSMQFLSETIDVPLFQQLGHRDDGKLIQGQY